jgi:hypothetical protein
MASTCGVLSANKKIPAQFLQAPRASAKDRGYFSGDGSLVEKGGAGSTASLYWMTGHLLMFGIRCQIEDISQRSPCS